MKKFLMAAVMIAAATIAHAGNGISAITWTYNGNQQSAWIKAIVTGDDDSNAVVRIFHRPFGSGGAYDTGMVMRRRVGFGPAGQDNAHTGNVYEGRVLNMDPNVVEQVYLEGIDPGGNFTTTTQNIACFPERQIQATGPVYYVAQRLSAVTPAIGNDLNDGRTPQYPFLTIGAAMTALNSSTAHGRNGGIFVGPGEYHERYTMDPTTFPTDGGPWFIEGYQGYKDTTIICGANQWVERGMYAPGKPLKWVYTGQDSTYKCYFPAATGPGDSTQLVVIGWGERLHRKTSMLDLLNDATITPGCGSCSNTGELSGWFWHSDTLYVKRKNGKSPSGNVIHTGYLDNLLCISRTNVRVANITFRFSGGLTNNPGNPADLDPGMNGTGIGVAFTGNADGLVVDSCSFYGFNAPAIRTVRGLSSGPPGWTLNGIAITNCDFHGLGLGQMAYSASKSRSEEDAEQVTFRGWNSSFNFNTISDTFNGFGGDSAVNDSLPGAGDEVIGNTFIGTCDDAVELDDSHDINYLVMGNTFRNCASCLSIAPIWDGGPIFFYSNLCTNFLSKGVKGAGGSVGIVDIVGNTFASSVAGCAAVDYLPGGGITNTYFTNNVISASCTGCAAIQGNDTIDPGNFFNFDVIGGTYLWNGVAWSFGGMQLFGQEANGLAAGTADFCDSTRANYMPTQGGAMRGRGRRWTGLNTLLNGQVKYDGTAPDIGAIERKVQ